jgi:hypothetical protein
MAMSLATWSLTVLADLQPAESMHLTAVTSADR